MCASVPWARRGDSRGSGGGRSRVPRTKGAWRRGEWRALPLALYTPAKREPCARLPACASDALMDLNLFELMNAELFAALLKARWTVDPLDLRVRDERGKDIGVLAADGELFFSLCQFFGVPRARA